MQPERRWTGAGQYAVDGAQLDRTPEFDPRTGEHLWIWIVVFRAQPQLIGDPTHTPILDMENLLSVSGPGCLYCEQDYSARLAARRCKGRP